MATMRESVIEMIGKEWMINFEEEEAATIENLKMKLEYKILQLAKETVAENEGISYEEVVENEISETVYDNTINELELIQIKVSDFTNLVIEAYPNYDFQIVYSLIHKIISNSKDFLVKPAKGYFEVNLRELTLPGAKKQFSKSVELKEFQDTLDNVEIKLKKIFNILEIEASDFIFKESDRNMLAKELELITQAVNCMKIYRIN
ncbi:hypothetical protein [Bacillus mycoides]|uniref:hypothetical protein n=1 Tax=Bacillus mycoides TaxID=1405 RepID=UPI001C0267E5|nr:hypothetical protein [Bacillus mycoides]QWG36676.1 hypothetical protein EXW30_28085 [Bacillus mycoides]